MKKSVPRITQTSRISAAAALRDTRGGGGRRCLWLFVVSPSLLLPINACKYLESTSKGLWTYLRPPAFKRLCGTLCRQGRRGRERHDFSFGAQVQTVTFFCVSRCCCALPTALHFSIFFLFFRGRRWSFCFRAKRWYLLMRLQGLPLLRLDCFRAQSCGFGNGWGCLGRREVNLLVDKSHRGFWILKCPLIYFLMFLIITLLMYTILTLNHLFISNLVIF